MSTNEMLKHIPEDQLLELDYFNNRGTFFVDRAFIPDKTGNKERIYSDAIKEYHEDSEAGGGRGLLSLSKHYEENMSHDDLPLFFTLFQWLATSVGRSVLTEALKLTGEKIVPIDDNKD